MSKIRAIVVAVALLMAAFAVAVSGGGPATQPSAFGAAPNRQAPVPPRIRTMLENISPRRMEHTIRTLVGFHNRNTLSAQNDPNEGIGAARDWIYKQFKKAARASDGRMTVHLQSYIQKPVPQEIPRATKITNVVATLHGTQKASRNRVYVVSGHYDSRCTDNFDTSCFAPGADDDASGVATSLELARVMAPLKFNATIVFMAVAGEEQGLFGSTHFVKVAKRNGVDIAGMLDDDIVGSSAARPHVIRLFSEGIPSDETPQEAEIRQAVGGENDGPARQLARYVKEVAQNSATGMHVALIFRLDRYLRGGDQIPFLDAGYRSAVRFTEWREDFNHEHQDVRVRHGVQFGDLPRFVDFRYAARVARVNGATLAALASAPASPRGAQLVATTLTNNTTLVWKANKEPDLAGYDVVWRKTTAPNWQHSMSVGNVHKVTLKLSKDDYFFGVRAVDKAGNRSPVSFPTPKF
jgi:Peptidase family M28